MDAATGSQKHFVSLLDVGDIGASTGRGLTTLGPSVGDDNVDIVMGDGPLTALGPSVGDDGEPGIQIPTRR
jgi:hypothetical protein